MNQFVSTINDRVVCLTAPNGSVMTGPGTNTYIIGRQGVDDLTLIDPGPVIKEHLQRILDVVQDRLKWIFVTHTHPDHSPLAAVLAKQTGAACVGPFVVNDGKQDKSFKADHVIKDGEMHLIDSSESIQLQAIHTPGHVDNHFCYLLKPYGLLFTGDHIMEGSTVVIIPPSGKMKDYLASLAKLKQYPIQALAPGHGKVMDNPMRVVDTLMKHRQMRERKVLRGLEQFDWVDCKRLTAVVYAEVPEKLHIIAEFSLRAHLIKLHHEGIVEYQCVDGVDYYRLV